MQGRHQDHIQAVMRLAGEGRSLAPAAAALHTPDDLIRDSWRRCVHQHRLDPTRMQEAVILPHHVLREHRERIDDFLHIARHGMETLYQQVAGMGYCVLLTDERGVTVDFIGDLQLDTSLRRAGLYLGADWSEHHAGTCGVGTAIATGQALTVHQDDHFDATHIPLTCTAAPVFDPLGRLNAILDISALSSPLAKSSQHLALQLVKVYAHHVENANFLRWFQRDWVLKLNPSPEFVDANPDYLVALDASGLVIGHNRRAQLLLEREAGGPVIGQPFTQLFNARFEELGRFVASRPTDQRALTLRASGRLLFLHAVPPPSRWATTLATEPSASRHLPAPLAVLSGGDAALDRQIERAARLVNSPVSMLLTGETGTGKEYFAKALHAASERRGKPFVAVNCAAIPESLIESELFGHTAGSFTGAATRGKRGLILEADGGTLFLDEIGDMPREAQARLLRVLAEREVLPVGASRPLPVNLRVISATHCDLEALVRASRFRDDLYYRLNGAHLQLPPLRERSDLAWLIRRMLREAVPTGAPVPTLAPEAAEWLRAWRWPGNLRELRNAIEYACAVCSGGYIGLADLPDALQAAVPHGAHGHVAAGPAALPAEGQLLLQYLRAAHWNVTAVARQLGVARMTLYRRMKRWGIEAPNHLAH
ncbi:sigma-54-dependent Fis family transcriptional regulator [Ideonella sp. A 288]|uniref:sigma-54-dependent Fis family transcriptional regulator n=1 Tax=Ideonella sp. A 288 TaxID=1962181 RepID=UPI000B4BDC4D|nr:sigma-54-dependent Fis family transcriptional regulator [Ideonella sp. A 288]